MLPNDRIAKAAIFPKYINTLNGGLFDDEALWRFHADDNKAPTEFRTSVCSLFSAKDETGVHEYGKLAASVANRRKGLADPSDDGYEVYIAFYDVAFFHALKAGAEISEVTCVWKPQHGLESHFEIIVSIFIEKMKSSANAKKNDMRRVRRQLWAGSVGPVLLSSEDDRVRELQRGLPIQPSPGQ